MGRMYTPGKVKSFARTKAQKKAQKKKKKKNLNMIFFSRLLGHFQICPPVPPHSCVVGQVLGQGRE
jgi:hypothetical protein